MEKKKFTTREAAKLVGVSRQTLQMWCKEKWIKAPAVTVVANLSVRLWSEADIQRAADFKGHLPSGPRPKKPSWLRGPTAKKSRRVYSLAAAAKAVGVTPITMRRWLIVDLGMRFPKVASGSKFSLTESQINAVLRKRDVTSGRTRPKKPSMTNRRTVI